ncbi:MAG: 2-amino-4-hydroxy-6-hydroxymethyldihydropteridine diphosphokinase [Muribaculaceae bacterium]
MNQLVLSIGSNSRDREWQIRHCIEWLRHTLSNVRVSTIYNSVAVNNRDADYLNAVMIAKTKKNFDDISSLMKQYEMVCGRTPASKLQGEIPIDIDIVLWNDDVLRQRDFAQQYFQRGWQELKEVEL